ncbi:hypothetical protein F3J23_01550 [Chryseobacterium sp. Tr-659]|uniref:hypothetical protein n=1 Tax=Chryseobacterium sp. Tr-659 TaxID=2608340 RepID=UPI00141E0900|nr:hypothetical protein [Chryseobacterium sp. Tr-659]NIF04111.1 hypothetical protein [Chryseobacterium sp. Tr-659]
MKKNFITLLSLGCLACCNPKKTEQEASEKNANSKYYTQLDTIIITTNTDDTIRYTKKGFNALIDKHPEFFNDLPDNPDELYFCFGNNAEFGSEVGQDRYFTLYSYFLKQRNGIEKYTEQRQKLINIFSNINSIYGYIAYGGTYFSHQDMRIPGYAEYFLYLYSLDKENQDNADPYDISKQKALYIQSLRQIIEDESKIDFESLGQAKIDRTKKMNTLVDEIDQLITSSYYLRCAQYFHYQYYSRL